VIVPVIVDLTWDSFENVWATGFSGKIRFCPGSITTDDYS